MSPERPHPHLAVEDHRGDDGAVIRVLRIDRVEKLGALSGDLVVALGTQIALIRASRAIRAVILTGTGRGFIAGADVGEYFQATAEEFRQYQLTSRQVFESLEALPQPTVAAVNGYAFGGGFELALCCDFIIASEGARFALPEVKLGLLPGGGGTQRLAQSAGIRFTKEIVMTGRTIRPDEAFRHNLLLEVTEAEQLLPRAIDFATTLAANAPLAVREAKRVIDDGIVSDRRAALTAEQSALGRLFDSADGREGIDAFIHKRTARFTGA